MTTTIYKFYADWCGPCRQVSSMLEDVIIPSDITIVNVNVEDEPQKATDFNVRGLPTMVKVDVEGKEISRKVGVFNSVDTLKDWVYKID